MTDLKAKLQSLRAVAEATEIPMSTTPTAEERIIVLEPRFVHRDGSSYFAGYSQHAGPCLDDAERHYRVIREEDVKEAKRQMLAGISEAREKVLNAKGIVGLRARFDVDPKYLANGHSEVAREMREAVGKIDEVLAILERLAEGGK